MSLKRTQRADEVIWLGRAFCSVNKTHPEFTKGNRGAIFNFACAAPSMVDCVAMIETETKRIKLKIRGLEFLFDKDFMDEEPTKYQSGLIKKLSAYPVQYRDVHFFPPDG